MTIIYEKISRLNKERTAAVLITVVGKEGHGPQQPGAKMLITSGGEKTGTIGGGSIENIAVNYAAEIFKSKSCTLKEYVLDSDNRVMQGEQTGMACGGRMTLFYEYLGVSDRVVLFGAGHVGKSLAYHLKNIGLFVTMVDSRKGLMDGITGIDEKVIGDPVKFLDDSSLGADTYVVVATHSHGLDFNILVRLLQGKRQPAYIGCVASLKKQSRFTVLAKEQNLDWSSYPHLYIPVGLDIGGAAPAEIAISIVSEIQALRYGKTGQTHLRQKYSK